MSTAMLVTTMGHDVNSAVSNYDATEDGEYKDAQKLRNVPMTF